MTRGEIGCVRRHRLSAWCVGCGMALAIFSARAEAPAPSAEFWNYLLEYGDANGQIFDPADLAVTAHVLPNAATEKPTDGGQPSAAQRVDTQGPATAPVASGESK